MRLHKLIELLQKIEQIEGGDTTVYVSLEIPQLDSFGNPTLKYAPIIECQVRKQLSHRIMYLNGTNMPRNLPRNTSDIFYSTEEDAFHQFIKSQIK
jgi:hypothetical protein